jgi:hypothetical protein
MSLVQGLPVRVDSAKKDKEGGWRSIQRLDVLIVWNP